MSLPTTVKHLNKFVSHSDNLLSGSKELTVKKLTDRQLLFVPCDMSAEPACIQFEIYDKIIAKAITNERAKFMNTMRMGGNYTALYGDSGAIPENWNMQTLPYDKRQEEAFRYEEEYRIWILKYDLRSRDTGERLTLEQLNQDLEEYMKQAPSTSRRNSMPGLEEIETSLRTMAIDKYTQGPDAQVLLRNQLDADIDSYMAQAREPMLVEVDPDEKFADEDFDGLDVD